MALSAEEKTFLLEKFPGQIDSATDSDLSKMFLYHLIGIGQREVSEKIDGLGRFSNGVCTFKHGIVSDSAGINFYMSFQADSAGLINLTGDSDGSFIAGISVPEIGE